jgi:hypothetical protein
VQTRNQPALLVPRGRGACVRIRGEERVREIAFEAALRRVEEPLKELDATLGTPFDDAYVKVKADVLKGAGIETLRVLNELDDRNG